MRWELSLVVGSVDLRFFFNPGCLGRPLWPADYGGPVGPSSLFSRVSSFYWWSFGPTGYVSLFPGGPGRPLGPCFLRLCLLDGPIFGPVGPLMFALSFSVAFPLCGLTCLGGSPFWSCWAVGRRPSGRGRRSSWSFD